MKKAEQLEKLMAVREMLSRVWIPWATSDGRGGHCQLGCLMRLDAWDLCGLIDAAALRLHPDLKGATYVRPGCTHEYEFESAPAIFVNNSLGKEAILAVYDDAIAQLEVAVLCEREQANEAHRRALSLSESAEQMSEVRV